MARIRTIKPEFPQSESMGRISRDARLLFIQMWTLADDSGRLRGNSRMLASLLFPYDEDAPKLIDGWLLELESENCIVRYLGDDKGSYVQISNWLDHQKIDKPSKSKLPEPNPRNALEPSRIVANPLEPSIPSRARADQGPRTKEGTKDQGEGEEGNAENPLSLSPHGKDPSFQKAWNAWIAKQSAKSGRIDQWTQQGQLKELARFSTAEAIEVVEYSTSRTNCVNLITNGDHKQKPSRTFKGAPSNNDILSGLIGKT